MQASAACRFRAAGFAALRRSTVFEGEAKFFDHRVGQDVARDPFNLGLGLGFAEAAVKREFEVFSLANVLQALVAHLFKRALDGLTLGIEDAFFQRNIDVGFHRLQSLYVRV